MTSPPCAWCRDADEYEWSSKQCTCGFAHANVLFHMRPERVGSESKIRSPELIAHMRFNRLFLEALLQEMHARTKHLMFGVF